MKLQYFELRQKHLNLFQTKERIYDSLLVIGNLFGITKGNIMEITANISRRDIASFSNISYENTIRTLKQLESEEIISFTKKKIMIRDKEFLLNSLKQLCCEKAILPELESCYLNLLY